MFNLWRKKSFNKLENSSLFDETSFYQQFIKDLEGSKNEVIIESPYITSTKMGLLLPHLKKLLDKQVSVHILTKDPIEHDELIRYQATNEILKCVQLGVNVKLIRGGHHRKIAIIDRYILWEGSLNILSQANSQEIMRRIDNKKIANEMFRFLNFETIL